MGLLRLVICVSGVYGAFLLWAIAQERLSKPFPSIHPQPHHSGASLDAGDKFPSSLFLNYAQALASTLSALAYLSISSWRDGSLRQKGLKGVLGLTALTGSGSASSPKDINGNGESKFNGHSNGVEKVDIPVVPLRRTLPFLLLQVSLFQTLSGPIGFLALRHISFPTMVLGKSCKLIPVLVLNVLLYRRRFSPHKYIVVALVTVGISMFMLFADSGVKRKTGENSVYGLTLLGINLLIDGLTNSTQDQIFSLYPSYSGQQMMFIMSLLTQSLLLPALLLPLPSNALDLLPAAIAGTEHRLVVSFSPPSLLTSLRFIASHPTALAPLLAYALLGGLGQLFIFETIASFGTLTLTMITVTRKLFTMLLSVFVFDHRLTVGQWAGVAVVFSGIGVEAGVKRLEVMRRARRN